MSHLDEARYGRACLLLLNVCPFTLRKVIDDFYTRSSYPNLQNFLDDQTRKHDLFHLLSKSCCCRTWQSKVTPMYRSQWELLYDKTIPPGHRRCRGDCPCKYHARPGITCDVMDITLCCLILTNICSVPTGIMNHIKTIREIRNKLIHASSASLDEITFNDYCMKIETAIYDLAKNVSPTVLTDTQEMVKELKTRVMNYVELGELRKMILDQKKFAELEERVSELERDHGNTTRAVKGVEERMTQTVAHIEGGIKQRVLQMEGSVKQRVAQMEGGVKQTMLQMEGRVDQKVAQMKGRVAQMEEGVKQKMSQMEGRLDQKVAQMEGRVAQRVAQMEGGVKREMLQMEGRVDQKTAQIEKNTDQRMTQIEGRVNQIKGKKMSHLERVVGQQGQEIKEVREEQVKARTDVSQGEELDIGPLRRKLFDINDYKTKIIPISPLQEGGDDEMPIELLYTTVVIREDPKYARKGHYSSNDTRTDPDGKSNKQQTWEMTNPDDIFKKDGEVARNIYMLGDAAHGKTTYCMWLLKKWCNAQQRVGMESKALDKWEKALHEFDFVFLLQFRYVNSSRASVIDMICQDVFRRDKGYHAAIRHVLSSDKYRSLIIMDGLDEWNPNKETRKQLTCKGMPNIEGVASGVSCFISMRPWVFPTISKIVERSDRVIEILGLSDTGMEKVIENVLLYHYKLKDGSYRYRTTYDKIVRHLENESLKSFMKIPLLAVVSVQIWYKEKQVGDSMTSFYAVMVDMLIERADQKHKLQIEHSKTEDCKLPQILLEKENVANYFSVLLKLGKVAYEGLLSKETNLVFQKKKLQKETGKRELQFALDVGLISQKEAPSLITQNVSVHFFHKSIQEFLAVIYIVTQKEVSDLFCNHLFNVKVIMKLSNVIKFICGMCPSLGSIISQRVVSVTDSNGEICKYRESPSWLGNNTVAELYKLQVSWYRELQYGQTDSPVTQTKSPVTQTDSPVTQTKSPVTQTDSPVTQTDSSVTDSTVTFHVSDVYLDDESDTETVRVTRELLSDHHVDIRSLFLYEIPTDGEDGITNKVLGDFLSNTHRTRSLVTLYINGEDITCRSVPTLCVPSLRFLYLHTVTINTDLCGNVCTPLLTDTSQLRVLVLDDVTLGEGGLGLSPDMVHIERIDVRRVTLGEGGLGLSPDMVHIKMIKLWCVTLGEGGLGLSPDMVHIKKVQLYFVTLGEGGLGRLSPDMVHIEEVDLLDVNMPAAGWGKFVRSLSHIQHRFNVVLQGTNIDDVSVTMILSSPYFTVTRDRVDTNGWYELHFTRVRPPSQFTHDDDDDDDDDDDGDELLYIRVQPPSQFTQ